MRAWPLIAAVLLLTACASAPPPPSAGTEAVLSRLEDGDATALDAALALLLSPPPGDAAVRERLGAALHGLALRRTQVETQVAAAAPDLSRQLVAERTIRLAVSGDDAAVIAERLARTNDWVVLSADNSANTILRLRRLPEGDAYAVVLEPGQRRPAIDAILRFDCKNQECVYSSLTDAALRLIDQ